MWDKTTVKQQPVQPDALIYASVVNQWLQANPLQAIAGDLVRNFTILTSIHKKRKLAQMKIDLLKQRVAQLEVEIDRNAAHAYGHKLNKLR